MSSVKANTQFQISTKIDRLQFKNSFLSKPVVASKNNNQFLPAINEKSEPQPSPKTNVVQKYMTDRKKLPTLSASHKKASLKLPKLTDKSLNQETRKKQLSIQIDDLGSSAEIKRNIKQNSSREVTSSRETFRADQNKSKLSQKGVTINSQAQKKIFDLDDDVDDYVDEDDDETFDDFIQKLHIESKQRFTPLSANVWTRDMLNTRNQENERQFVQNRTNFKFGSCLSEDGRYAMLKAYEDMLYFELLTIFPQPNIKSSLSRTNTEIFLHLPRKSTENKKLSVLPQIKQTNQNQNLIDNLNSDENKLKFCVSKELEKAMKIYDEIKKQKGQLTTTCQTYKINNLIGAYDLWKKTALTEL